MKLYYHPLSAYSRKVLLALHEKQVAFTPEVVNLFDPTIKAEFKKDVNPFGKLPVLKLEDQDWMIPESSIIIEYLDTHFDSGTDLIPADPDQARQVRFNDRISDLYLLEPAVFVLLENLFTPEADRNQKMLASKTAKVQETLGLLNQHIGDRPYLFGESFTMADISASVGCYLVRNMLQFPMNDYPKVQVWLDRVVARDSWQHVLKEAEPFLAAMRK